MGTKDDAGCESLADEELILVQDSDEEDTRSLLSITSETKELVLKIPTLSTTAEEEVMAESGPEDLSHNHLITFPIPPLPLSPHKFSFESTDESEMEATGTLRISSSPVKAKVDPILNNLGHLFTADCSESAYISEYEQKSLPEFFRTQGVKFMTKTPARYLSIRSGILSLWHDSFAPKRKYLNKLTCRKHLIESVRGDSGCFSRVHIFLEDIGAINDPVIIGQKSSSEPKKAQHLKSAARKELTSLLVSNSVNETLSLSSIYLGKRSRKPTKPASAFKTIAHDSNSLHHRPRRKLFTSSAHRPHNHLGEEFRLVPLVDDTISGVPFEVHISGQAMALMRLHAILSPGKEIIGLIGGKISFVKEAMPILDVSEALPCKTSAASSIECDMDAVSEMQASELLQAQGLCILGWYHSHPGFDPDPSIRDIETQSVYQDAFRSSQDDGLDWEPFVGVIVSPPSRVECLHLAHDSGDRIPLKVPIEISNPDAIDFDILAGRLEEAFIDNPDSQEFMPIKQITPDVLKSLLSSSSIK